MQFAPRWVRYSLTNRRNLWIVLFLALVIVSVWYLKTPSLGTESMELPEELNEVLFETECFSHNPYVLFFNRIPKSGSTTLQDFFRTLSNLVDVETDIYPEGATKWTLSKIEEVENRAMALLKRAKLMHGGHGMDGYSPRGIYIQHFYYTEFPGLSAFGMNYGYITLVREPVDRVISAYYYYHFTKNFKIPVEDKMTSLSDCVKNELYGCEANIMTQYFCGHEDSCVSKNGDHKYALYTAKQNLLKYIAIGLTEDFLSSIKLFQKLLPDILPRFVELPTSLKKQNANEIDYKKDVSESDRILIREKNVLDIQIYAFAKDLFDAKLKECSISGE
ncbi:Uronyl 2-sulfotransferase-like [Oopsacas minuta]|uniref:Uronyl 2-sulfotransferase-like n=1 Tax=Oopsacas minuta TaxID=111878 RepID=A0AAV7K1Z2_9METZ|nr:Uronyl 2-sulfotransferase-like [Oopsacas minuta]